MTTETSQLTKKVKFFHITLFDRIAGIVISFFCDNIMFWLDILDQINESEDDDIMKDDNDDIMDDDNDENEIPSILIIFP